MGGAGKQIYFFITCFMHPSCDPVKTTVIGPSLVVDFHLMLVVSRYFSSKSLVTFL